MAWLTSGDTYKSKNSGSGSSFVSVSPTATSQSVSWTSVPAAVVPGGLSKAIVVGVLMAGNTVSVGGSSPHVYHAIDSTMGPKMDLSIPSFTASTPAGASYVRGDIVTLDATVANTEISTTTAAGRSTSITSSTETRTTLVKAPKSTHSQQAVRHRPWLPKPLLIPAFFLQTDGRPSSTSNFQPVEKALPPTTRQPQNSTMTALQRPRRLK